MTTSTKRNRMAILRYETNLRYGTQIYADFSGTNNMVCVLVNLEHRNLPH